MKKKVNTERLFWLLECLFFACLLFLCVPLAPAQEYYITQEQMEELLQLKTDLKNSRRELQSQLESSRQTSVRQQEQVKNLQEALKNSQARSQSLTEQLETSRQQTRDLTTSYEQSISSASAEKQALELKLRMDRRIIAAETAIIVLSILAGAGYMIVKLKTK